MKSFPLLAALWCACASSVLAQDRFNVPVTGEILTGWVQADGSRMAALQLTLAPGWKTYWRTPGDAGIPPQFDWSGSRNLDEISISWPAPVVFGQNGMRSVGYKDTVVIPFEIQPSRNGRPVRLEATMDLGVCSDVCVPHSLDFSAVLDGDEATPTPAIAAALAAQPYSAREAGVRAAECYISPTVDGLQIETRLTMPSAGTPEYVVIEPGQGEIWVSEADTKRTGGTLIASSELVHVNGGAIALDRSAVRITVLGSKYAVDVQGCAG